MKDLERLHRSGQTREFHKLVKTLTNFGQRSQMVGELVLEDTIVSDRDTIEKTLTEHFEALYKRDYSREPP